MSAIKQDQKQEKKYVNDEKVILLFIATNVCFKYWISHSCNDLT